jgi:hypothetical protein
MGQQGMADMAEVGMPVPRNSVPMVRDQLSGYRDPGWYEDPPGTLTAPAEPHELGRDGINPAFPPRAEPAGAT